MEVADVTSLLILLLVVGGVINSAIVSQFA